MTIYRTRRSYNENKIENAAGLRYNIRYNIIGRKKLPDGDKI